MVTHSVSVHFIIMLTLTASLLPASEGHPCLPTTVGSLKNGESTVVQRSAVGLVPENVGGIANLAVNKWQINESEPKTRCW
jgi:hypothetical protein